MPVTRYTPHRLALLDALLGADQGTTGYQTTDDVPTHLILNGRAVSEKTSEAFRALLGGALVKAEGGQVTMTGAGQRRRLVWLDAHGDDPRLAGLDLLRLSA